MSTEKKVSTEITVVTTARAKEGKEKDVKKPIEVEVVAELPDPDDPAFKLKQHLANIEKATRLLLEQQELKKLSEKEDDNSESATSIPPISSTFFPIVEAPALAAASKEDEAGDPSSSKSDEDMIIASVTPISRQLFQDLATATADVDLGEIVTTAPTPSLLLDEDSANSDSALSGLGLGDESLVDDHKTSLLFLRA